MIKFLHDFLKDISDYNLQHFWLASVVVVGFFIVLAIAICIDRTYSAFEKVTSTLGPIVGAVVGYYFGRSKTSKRISRRLRIIDMSPEDKEKNVPINTTIKLWFSDPVDKNTVNDHSFRISYTDKSNNQLQQVQGSVAVHDFKAEMKPNTPLKLWTVYTVIVTTEVKDVNGNVLTTDEKWSFETIAPKSGGGGSPGGGGGSPPPGAGTGGEGTSGAATGKGPGTQGLTMRDNTIDRPDR